MGNGCSCDPQSLELQNCPTVPAIQCRTNFTNECSAADNVCTTFKQGFPTALSPFCHQPNGCCPGTAPNGANSWLFKVDSCQSQCASVDSEGCLILNNIGPEICAGEVNGNIAVNPSEELNVTCKWPTSAFTSLAAVGTWETTYGRDTSADNFRVWNTKIMPTLCSGFQSNAINGPGTCPQENNQGPWVGGICSAFVANNTPTGNKCQDWIRGIAENDAEAKAGANRAIFGYCRNLANINQIMPGLNLDVEDGEVNECLCINRGKDPDGLFNQILQLVGTNQGLVNSLGKVGCWYAPCSAGLNQIIPLKTADTIGDFYPTDCPDVCQIVNIFRGTIENSTIQDEIKCDNSTPTPPGGTGNRQGPGENGNGDDDDDRSFLKRYWWVAVIAGAVVILLIIIIIVVIATSGGKKKDKDKGGLTPTEEALLF